MTAAGGGFVSGYAAQYDAPLYNIPGPVGLTQGIIYERTLEQAQDTAGVIGNYIAAAQAIGEWPGIQVSRSKSGASRLSQSNNWNLRRAEIPLSGSHRYAATSQNPASMTFPSSPDASPRRVAQRRGTTIVSS